MCAFRSQPAALTPDVPCLSPYRHLFTATLIYGQKRCVPACCVPHMPHTSSSPTSDQPHITHHFSLSCDATQVVWPRLLFQLPLTLAGHVLCRAAPERTPDGIRQVSSYVVHARLRAHLISSHPAPIAALYIHCIQSWARQKGLRMTSTATSPPCRSRPNTGVFRSRASL